MNKWRNSWTLYSVGIFAAWAVVLIARSQIKSGPSFNEIMLLFAGFFLGWLSATIKLTIMRASKDKR